MSSLKNNCKARIICKVEEGKERLNGRNEEAPAPIPWDKSRNILLRM